MARYALLLHILQSACTPPRQGHYMCVYPQVGHVEDVVVDDGYRGQRMGQRSASVIGPPMGCGVHLPVVLNAQSQHLKVLLKRSGSLLPWYPMPKAKDAIKLFWTAQTAMCHFMRNVASQGRKSRWSVPCTVLHCKQSAGHATQSLSHA